MANQFGTAVYVCKYASKPDAADQSVLTKAFKEGLAKLPDGASVDRQRLALLNADIGHRECSMQEVAYILLGHALVEKSRDVIAVDANPLNKQRQKLKDVAELAAMDDDRVDLESDGPYSKRGMLDNYAARLSELGGMTFHTFVKHYVYSAAKTKQHEASLLGLKTDTSASSSSSSSARPVVTGASSPGASKKRRSAFIDDEAADGEADEEEEEDEEQDEFESHAHEVAPESVPITNYPRSITLSNGRCMIKRRVSAVVIPAPFSKLDLTDEQSCYTMLLLYIPWTDINLIQPTSIDVKSHLAKLVAKLPAHMLAALEAQGQICDVIASRREDDADSSDGSNEECDDADGVAAREKRAQRTTLAAVDINDVTEQEQFHSGGDGSDARSTAAGIMRSSSSNMKRARDFIKSEEARTKEVARNSRLLNTSSLAELAAATGCDDAEARGLRLNESLMASLRSLNTKQELIFRLFQQALSSSLSLRDRYHSHDSRCSITVLKIIILGSGGTGKSWLIDTIVKQARVSLPVSADCGGRWGPVLIMAFTGTAAFNIKGNTIHSSLHIGQSTNSEGLASSETVDKLQKEMAGVEFVILDEVSMVNADLLSLIDSRLRLAFSDCAHLPFGGRHMLFFGDLYQLPSVRCRAVSILYSAIFDKRAVTDLESASDENSGPSAGRKLWLSIKHVIELDEHKRQSDAAFIALLERARVGMTTDEDVALLNQRVVTKETALARVGQGGDTCWASSTRANVDLYNAECLQRLSLTCAIVNLHARHMFHAAGVRRKNGVSDPLVSAAETLARLRCYKPTNCEQRHLPSFLQLGVGASVMLTDNLSVSLGLVNGAVGKVYGFVYDKDLKSPIAPYATLHDVSVTAAQPQLPIVLVQFPAHVYSGSSWVSGVEGVVPISPKTVPLSEMSNRSETYNREQLPLTLAWAITIHKTQGKTLTSLVLDPHNVFERGQLYVAVSRVKTFEGLFLLSKIHKNDFRRNVPDLLLVTEEMSRLRALEQATITHARRLPRIVVDQTTSLILRASSHLSSSSPSVPVSAPAVVLPRAVAAAVPQAPLPKKSKQPSASTSSSSSASRANVVSGIWIANNLYRVDRASETGLLDPSAFVDDSVINAVQCIIKQHTLCDGLQDPLAVQNNSVLHADVQTHEGPQILHNGTNHWIVALPRPTFTNINNTNLIPVEIYDSLNSNTLSSRVLQQLDSLFGNGHYEIVFKQCPSQGSTVHCGPIACANAMNLASGIDITNLHYDLDKIRTHTHDIICKQTFLLYPLVQRRSGRAIKPSNRLC